MERRNIWLVSDADAASVNRAHNSDLKIVLGYQNKDYEGVLEALKTGALKPEKMITSKIRIDRVAEDGFRPLIDEKDKHVKILVDLKA